MTNYFSLFATIILFASSGTFAQAQTKEMRFDFSHEVTAEYTDGQTNWSNGGKTMEYKWRVLVQDGFFAICGAYKHINNQFFAADKDVLRNLYVTYNDQVIVDNMRYFAKYKRKEDLIGKVSNCRKSTIKAPKGRFTVYMEARTTRTRF